MILHGLARVLGLMLLVPREGQVCVELFYRPTFTYPDKAGYFCQWELDYRVLEPNIRLRQSFELWFDVERWLCGICRRGGRQGQLGSFLYCICCSKSLRWEIVDPAATDAWTQ